MKNIELKNKATRSFGKVGLYLKKHSPEILVVTGVVGVVASAVMACKATPKAIKIVEETKKDLELRQYAADHPQQVEGGYTEEEHKKDVTIVTTKAALSVAKTYAPSILLGAVSITAIFTGSNILRKRNMALGAAYAALDTGFKEYRKRVVDRFGEDMDKELKYNIKKEEIEETVVDENGKEKKVKKTVEKVGEPALSPYTFCFDECCTCWQRDPEHNKWFLATQQKYANQKLKARGYLFLNEVLESLGIRPTKAGQVVGWMYDEKYAKDGYVDFGILDISDESKRDFVNGREQSVWLNFNVDGPIYDLI